MCLVEPQLQDDRLCLNAPEMEPLTIMLPLQSQDIREARYDYNARLSFYHIFLVGTIFFVLLLTLSWLHNNARAPVACGDGYL